MCSEHNISSFTAVSTLIALVLIVNISLSTASTTSIAIPSTKSTLSDTITNNRHKRAPGWGKRAPGWGKRAPGWGKRQSVNTEYFDEFDDSDMLNTINAFKQAVYLSGRDLPAGRRDHTGKKRAPGWGKRCCTEDEFSTNWASGRRNDISNWDQPSGDMEIDDELTEIGKRAPGWGKRAPGWGKRAPGWGKRAPGWGKRNYYIDLDTDDAETGTVLNALETRNRDDQEILENTDNVLELSNSNTALRTASLLSGDILSAEKRAPGWGKRAPGWGKRNYYLEPNFEDTEIDKRAPGWGKRAPGWGKRAPGWGKRNYEIEMDTIEADKRAPGWGKRTAVRVKRSFHSKMPSIEESCQSLHNLENNYLARVKELAARRSEKCGNMKVANEHTRK